MLKDDKQTNSWFSLWKSLLAIVTAKITQSRWIGFKVSFFAWLSKSLISVKSAKSESTI